MNRSRLILSAWMLDQLAGDPEWLPHPVRLIGLGTARGEAALRRSAQSDLSEFASGAALTLAVVASSYYVTQQVIRFARSVSPTFGDTLEALLAWTCLAARNLEQEATSVVNALACDDLALARRQLARIVGRDTENLDVAEVCRALIETLAESASDGIIAPIFYMAIGGVPLAMAYKAVNTLDSMIGHADERYFYFGKIAARLDDAANYVPARLTSAAIVAVSTLEGQYDAAAAAGTWGRDGGRHKSPNAGQPESAMAGALRVRLGGDNTYRGELVRADPIGHEFPVPSLQKTKSALRMVGAVTLLGVIAAALLSRVARLPRTDGASQ